MAEQARCTNEWPRRTGVWPLLAAVAAVGLGGAPAHAQEPAVPQELAVVAAPTPAEARFGVALRTRWVSIPGWAFDAFTDANQPLSSYGLGGELFWRDRTARIDVSLGFSYQRMSPPDGNWLGAGDDPSAETDFVQFRDVALYGLDATVTWRQPLSQYVGLHYGAGLGMAIVSGKMLRTSASRACNAANVHDTAACRPIICPPSGCTEQILKASEGDLDYPEDPHRYADDDLPGALPVLHLVAGVHAALPSLPGFEARLEAGIYDAFFVGLGVAYLF